MSRSCYKIKRQTENLLKPNLWTGFHVAVLYRAVAVVGPEWTRTLQVHLSRKHPRETLIMIKEVTDRFDNDYPNQLSQLHLILLSAT